MSPKPITLSPEVKPGAEDWLALYFLGLGNKRLHQLHQNAGDDDFWSQALRLAKPEQRAQLNAWLGGAACPWQQQINSLKLWLQQADNHLLLYGQGDYPPLLREISDPPFVLFARGQLRCLSMAYLAVVGARQCTPLGRKTAQEFVHEISRDGLGIISGLALGIDTVAHRAALEAQAPTIAVLGNGIARVYPRANAQLAEEIAQAGLLISEFPPDAPPRREHFPQRNRTISGIALATLVVEAGLRSGSLITARLASEQGREVFAIPGAINNPYAAGCLQLIGSGAQLTTEPQQIVTQLQPLLARQSQLVRADLLTIDTTPTPAPETSLSPPAQRALAVLEYRLMHIDEVSTLASLTSPETSAALLELELAGLVGCQSGHYQKL